MHYFTVLKFLCPNWFNYKLNITSSAQLFMLIIYQLQTEIKCKCSLNECNIIINANIPVNGIQDKILQIKLINVIQ